MQAVECNRVVVDATTAIQRLGAGIEVGADEHLSTYTRIRDSMRSVLRALTCRAADVAQADAAPQVRPRPTAPRPAAHVPRPTPPPFGGTYIQGLFVHHQSIDTQFMCKLTSVASSMCRLRSAWDDAGRPLLAGCGVIVTGRCVGLAVYTVLAGRRKFVTAGRHVCCVGLAVCAVLAGRRDFVSAARHVLAGSYRDFVRARVGFRHALRP